MPQVAKAFSIMQRMPVLIGTYEGSENNYGYQLFCPNLDGDPVPFAFSLPAYSDQSESLSAARELIYEVKRGILREPKEDNNLATWIKRCFIWPDFMK